MNLTKIFSIVSFPENKRLDERKATRQPLGLGLRMDVGTAGNWK